MNRNNAVGSIWNKWDLHIHAPGTKKANGYLPKRDSNWPKFYEELEKSDVMVFGITDYFSFDNYIKVRDEFYKKYPNSGKVFFPNVELNLDRSSNGKNDGYNVHLIFDNLLSDESLNKFLQKLELDTNDEKGAPITADEIPSSKSVSFESSYTTIDKLRSALKKTFGEKKCYLIATVLHGHRGMQPDNNNGVKPEIAKNTDHQMTDIFFGCDEKDVLFGLNKNSQRGMAVPKPVISGSDAHSFEHISERLGKSFINNRDEKDKNKQRWSRPTWIKSDLTFTGLLQIKFEPAERVRLQYENPYSDKSKIYFSSIAIKGSKHYVLADFFLGLNRELVVLIGGRGAGKSALLETFALFNEEHQKEDRNQKKKVVEYFRHNLNRVDPPPYFLLQTKLVDKNNDEKIIEKKLSDITSYELPFLYLGQEDLSAKSTNDEELTQTICNLLNIDIDDERSQKIIAEARALLSDIENISKSKSDLVESYFSYGLKPELDFESWIVIFLQKLEDQQKRLSSKETKKILEDINKKTEKGLKLKDLKSKADSLISQLQSTSIIDEIKFFNSNLDKIYPELTKLKLIDVSTQIDALKAIKTKSDHDMDVLRGEINEVKKKLIEQGIKEDVNSLIQASENLQKQIININRDLQKFKQFGLNLQKLHESRKELLEKIKDYLQSRAEQINSAFNAFIKSRDDSTEEEKSLFIKMVDGISVEGRVVFDASIFLNKALEGFFDKRSIYDVSLLKSEIVGRNREGNPNPISFDDLITWIQKDHTSSNIFSKNGLRGLTDYIFTEWPSFYKVRAIAKLNNKPTDILSIGQRGTLLLKVYLSTSTARQVIIIDQPEDNLDNNFIMNELVPLLREAKKSRQIIISTHNANLVVNTDAEQVVVARLDKDKDYISGGLENPMIIQSVCQILEGGQIAFQKREQRYVWESASQSIPQTSSSHLSPLSTQTSLPQLSKPETVLE